MNDENAILLVEDNTDDEALTLRALKKCDFHTHVVVVRDGVEALDYLFSTGDCARQALNPLPRIVLLDLKLPRIGGLEVLQKLREHPRTAMLPVVVLTTSIEESDVNTSYRLGVNSYVRKPIDFVRFVDAVRQLAHYWLGMNVPPPATLGRD